MRRMLMRRKFVRAIAADSLVAASCVEAVSFQVQRTCVPTRRCIPLSPASTPER